MSLQLCSEEEGLGVEQATGHEGHEQVPDRITYVIGAVPETSLA